MKEAEAIAKANKKKQKKIDSDKISATEIFCTPWQKFLESAEPELFEQCYQHTADGRLLRRPVLEKSPTLFKRVAALCARWLQSVRGGKPEVDHVVRSSGSLLTYTETRTRRRSLHSEPRT